MKIEVGKYYKTRYGERVFVFGKTERGRFACESSTGILRSVNEQGRCHLDRDSSVDLVKLLPWCNSFEDEEPGRIEGWVNLYRDDQFNRQRAVWLSRQDARVGAVSSSSLIKTVFICEALSEDEIKEIVKGLPVTVKERHALLVKLRDRVGCPAEVEA